MPAFLAENPYGGPLKVAEAVVKQERAQYFRSWVSYQIPMKPVDPVDFAGTEGAASFYLGRFDRNGRLVRFTKFLRQETPADAAATRQAAARPGGYHAAVPHPGGGRDDGYTLGEPIPFSDTEGREAYFRVLDGTESQAADLRLVRVGVQFDDQYEYWPDGTLKTRILTRADGSVRRVDHDRQGRETSAHETGP